MAVIVLDKNNFKKTIDDNKLVVVDFWAPWCGPCKSFAPTYDEVSNKFSDIVFAKVNTEDEQQLAVEHQIRSIPTLMIFKEQIIIFSQPGALSQADLESVVQKAKKIDMNKVREEIKKSKTKG